MKFLLLPVLATLSLASPRPTPTAFQRSHSLLFGIRGGSEERTQDDYERAEKAIFHGMEVVEHKLQKAVEDEVHSIFDEMDHDRKKEVSEHVKKAVSKGASKARSTAEREYSSKKRMPFLPKHAEEEDHPEDHRILHAMEAAEKAVLHAVKEEVDTIFHGNEHPLQAEPQTTKKAKAASKKGFSKGAKHVEDTHEERKRWIKEMDSKAIDEYIRSSNSMYGMGF